jgi:small subunit ribosomal protein S1
MMQTTVLLPTSYIVGSGNNALHAPAHAGVAMRSGVPACVTAIDASSFGISNPGSLSRDERLRSRYSGYVYEPEGGWGDSADELFSYDELSASMREMVTYTRGDTTTGEVIGFEPNGALIDINVKSSAYCTLQEMALVKPSKPEEAMEIGASYEFVIVSREDENGQLMLSRRRILFGEAWDKVAQLYADDATVEAEVTAVNRGGAMCVVEGLRAFLPGSHFLPGQTPTEEIVGKKMAVKFLDVDKDTTRLIVSHRKAVVDQQIHELSVGSVLKGVVTAVKPYGAFVDVGGMSGLLHISQISCDHIGSIEQVIPVGTAIKCMVISQDKGKGRVALSTKTLEQEPGDMIKNQAKVFENAEETAAKYQERIAAERKAREEAAQDVIFGLESVFTEPADAADGEGAAEDAPAAEELPLEEA